MAFLRSEVAEESRLRLIPATIHMSEVADKQIELAVVVEIAPRRADGMAAIETGGRTHGVAGSGLILELPLAVVQPQHVRLQAIVRHIHVQVAVLIEITGGHAASAVADLAPRQLEGLAFLVHKQQVRIRDPSVPVFVTSDVEIDEAVAVEVAAATAHRDTLGERRYLDRLEALASLVAKRADRRARKQVHESVIVEIGGDDFAESFGQLSEPLAAVVPPDDSPRTQIGPAVVVDIDPTGLRVRQL